MEVVEGLEQATNRLEQLAADDPTCDYFLYSAQAGKVVRRQQWKSSRPDDIPGDSSRKKAG
jgi:hypothetical protein